MVKILLAGYRYTQKRRYTAQLAIQRASVRILWNLRLTCCCMESFKKTDGVKKAALILCTLLHISCSSKPQVVNPVPGKEEKANQSIFITSHSWHTGIVLSAENVHEKMSFLFERFGNASYFEFGWGDQDYYQSRNVTSGIALKAAFWPTDSVTHVIALTSHPSDYFSSIEMVKIDLTASRMSSLNIFLANSFFRDSKGNLKKTTAGHYGNSQFYQGRGDYHLFNTCNKWTAKGLRSAGVNISTSFKFTSNSIIDYLKKHCRDQTSCAFIPPAGGFNR